MKRLILCFLGFNWFFAQAQTEPVYTTFFLQPSQINPAAGSMQSAIETGLVGRFQYTGLSSRMTSTQGFDFSFSVPQAHSVFGLRVNNDFIGLQRSTWVTAQYAYRKAFQRWNLSVGVEAGIIQMSLDGSRMTTPDGDYQPGSIQHNDAFLAATVQQAVAPQFSVGLAFHGKSFFSGISLQQIAWSNAFFPAEGGRSRVVFTRVMNVHGGYSFRLGERFSLRPSLMIRTDWVKWQGEVNLLSTLWDNIYLGMSFRGYNQRSFESISGMAGYRFLRHYLLLYAYDGSISPLRAFHTGSHEITLRMFFSVKSAVKEGYRYHIPRFL